MKFITFYLYIISELQFYISFNILLDNEVMQTSKRRSFLPLIFIIKKFILYAKLEGFSNIIAYIYKLTDIFWRSSFKSIWNFRPEDLNWNCRTVYLLSDLTDYAGNGDNIITHVYGFRVSF